MNSHVGTSFENEMEAATVERSYRFWHPNVVRTRFWGLLGLQLHKGSTEIIHARVYCTSTFNPQSSTSQTLKAPTVSSTGVL